MKKTTAAAAAPPTWITITPEPASFGLVAYEGPELTGSALQEIEVTREEYGALKEHLASIRDLLRPAETAAA